MLHNLAHEYGQRPSAIVGVRDEWAAYQFDAAVLQVGREIEAALINGKRLDEVLPGAKLSPEDRVKRGEFRSVAGMVNRRGRKR